MDMNEKTDLHIKYSGDPEVIDLIERLYNAELQIENIKLILKEMQNVFIKKSQEEQLIDFYAGI